MEYTKNIIKKPSYKHKTNNTHKTSYKHKTRNTQNIIKHKPSYKHKISNTHKKATNTNKQHTQNKEYTQNIIKSQSNKHKTSNTHKTSYKHKTSNTQNKLQTHNMQQTQNNVISDLFKHTTYIHNSLIHSWRHVSVLANHLQANNNYMDMVHLVSAYILGSHTVYKPLFSLKSSVKSIGRYIFNIYVKPPVSA
jgi:hypothetical protein